MAVDSEERGAASSSTKLSKRMTTERRLLGMVMSRKNSRCSNQRKRSAKRKLRNKTKTRLGVFKTLAHEDVFATTLRVVHDPLIAILLFFQLCNYRRPPLSQFSLLCAPSHERQT